MPIYEYRCNDCGRQFEAMQKFSDKPVKKCAHCEGANVEKLMSQSSFVLKGNGWHKTDYNAKGSCPTEAPAGPACASCPASKAN